MLTIESAKTAVVAGHEVVFVMVADSKGNVIEHTFDSMVEAVVWVSAINNLR